VAADDEQRPVPDRHSPPRHPAPEPVNYLNTRLLEQCDLAEDELRRIERENALALLS
jgi:hypothetical protein